MITPDKRTIECRTGPSEPLHRLAAQVAGRQWHSTSPEALASLLLPIVRRMIHTGRGPLALRQWVAREEPAKTSAGTDRTARSLAATLVQLLLEPTDAQRETVRY